MGCWYAACRFILEEPLEVHAANKKFRPMKQRSIHLKTAFLSVLSALILLPPSCHRAQAQESLLKDAYGDQFYMGAALNRWQFSGRDTLSAGLVKKHFNSISPVNSMKWERIHPEPGKYNFGPADRFVAFGEENGMHIVAHTLVWHSQVPGWVFRDREGNLVSRDTLLHRMRDHIHTVVGRYRGKIDCWDVVNEAVADDGAMRNSLWYRIIGEDFVEKAFTYAREADPDATLIYNDHSLPNPDKRDGVLRLARKLQSAGIRVDGIGLQGHYHLDDPDIGDLEASIDSFASLGVKVMITELDVSVLPWPSMPAVGADVNRRFEVSDEMNPYPGGLPDSVQSALADRYGALFSLFSEHGGQIERVTFWGVHDGTSWKNHWPIPGRTDYPLLFDREGNPKPAFDAVIRSASESNRIRNPSPLSPPGYSPPHTGEEPDRTVSFRSW